MVGLIEKIFQMSSSTLSYPKDNTNKQIKAKRTSLFNYCHKVKNSVDIAILRLLYVKIYYNIVVFALFDKTKITVSDIGGHIFKMGQLRNSYKCLSKSFCVLSMT